MRVKVVACFAVIVAAVLVCLWTTSFAHESGSGADGGHAAHAALDPWLIAPGGIDGTAHDFDALADDGDPETDEQGCIVCHDGPNWNHEESGQSLGSGGAGYTTSTSTGTSDPQPGDVSLKCLDCHDGTVPVDAFGGDAGTAGEEIQSGDAGYLGIDLKHHHPVGIVYDDSDSGAQMVPRLSENRYGSLPDELLVGPEGARTVECVSCHNQHTHAQANNPDNEPGKYSHVHEWGHFVRLDHLCFHCHERYQSDVVNRKISPYGNADNAHHFPGRTDPYGESRGGVNGDLEFACSHCHDVAGEHPTAPGSPHNSPCVDCHYSWDPDSQDSPADAPTSHHGYGAERHDPLAECAVCHADPGTGQLTGAPFGIYDTPSCGECHADPWSEEALLVFSVDAGGPYEDELGDPTTLTATFVPASAPSEGDTLTASWNLGDGTPTGFPTTITYVDTGGGVMAWDGDLTIDHTFPVGVTNGSVTLADGVSTPVSDTFKVTVTDPAAPTPDSWDVEPVVEDDFEITFSTAAGGVDGVFSSVKDGLSVGFGIEAADTIFWFDMEFTVDSWGVGSTYFGNIDRDEGTMNGVIITAVGGLDTFEAEKN